MASHSFCEDYKDEAEDPHSPFAWGHGMFEQFRVCEEFTQIG